MLELLTFSARGKLAELTQMKKILLEKGISEVQIERMIDKAAGKLKVFFHKRENVLVFLCLLLESSEKEYLIDKLWKNFIDKEENIRNEIFRVYTLINRISNIG